MLVKLQLKHINVHKSFVSRNVQLVVHAFVISVHAIVE